MPPQRRILIFEDDEIYGHALVATLRTAGFAVTLTSHFAPALDALDCASGFDLLVTDIVVPSGVNGFALSRMARMRHRQIKVIYITGYDLPGAEQEALGPILRKPVPEDVLVGEIRRLLA